MIKHNLLGETYQMSLPTQICDTREFMMTKEFCDSLAREVTDLLENKVGFRLYVEEYNMTKKEMSWQARLASLPEISQSSSGSAPIMTIGAQVQYDAVNHNNSTENYHGCFNMTIQTIAVPGDQAALAMGKKWMVDSRAYSIMRLAESQYRSAIKLHYHEWGTHYEDCLNFVDNPEVFMRDLQVYPEFQKDAGKDAK